MASSSTFLSAPDLLHQAQQQVPDVPFNPQAQIPTALEILVDSLNGEAQLHDVGVRYFEEFLLRLLTNHLRLQQDYQRLPVTPLPLVRPLFVVGLFRSGTTFLHNLLAQDPGCRWLSVAEALYPTPAPQQDGWLEDPRIAQAVAHLQFQSALAPNFSAAHHIEALRPAECSRLFEHDLIGHLFDFRANVPTYSQWLLQQDLTDAYQSYRQQLQYLSTHWPGTHWVLKAPAHLFALDTLLNTFPDAAIVYLHRDPVQVLPSCCSLSATGRSRFSEHINPETLGLQWLNTLSEAVKRSQRARKQLSSEHRDAIYDVDYRDLVKNPLGTIQGIYEHFQYDYSPGMVENLQQWIAQNPQHKHGVHRYTLEQFGLSAQQVQAVFSR
jgi:hypothetical protein